MLGTEGLSAWPRVAVVVLVFDARRAHTTRQQTHREKMCDSRKKSVSGAKFLRNSVKIMNLQNLEIVFSLNKRAKFELEPFFR